VRHAAKRSDGALLDLREAERREPDNLDIQNNIAAILVDQEAWQEVSVVLLKILEKAPDHLDALANLSTVYAELKRYDEAVDITCRRLKLKPDDPEIYLALLRQLRSGGLLTRFGEVFDEAKVKAAFEKAQRFQTFHALTYLDQPPWHRQVARRQAQTQPLYALPARPAKAPADGRPDKRLRIGYWSCDLQEHATSQLISEVFELHDRQAFEVVILSYGPPSNTPARDRIVRAADRFFDFHGMPDREAVDRIAALDIDILVDLKGYTKGTRMAIPLSRPAPIVVSWLGYPGTLGSDKVDYIVGDRVVTPPGCEAFYDERIIRLPGCYQPNDRHQAVAEPLDRQGYGLPADAVVFAVFNATQKITPEMFNVWMRVLKACPQACLWLFAENDAVFRQFITEAGLKGVPAARIVHAGIKDRPHHIARYKVADLAVDTFPYGSHTTGSDALRAGCPLLALAGRSFASRVSASLLEAAGLPELVTASLADYEARLLDLLRSPASLQALRARLAQVERSVLFNAPAFVTGLERALRGIWQDHLDKAAA
jgi:predicted O-linked N-acetylglucosamine transferase (SPINDLY family)